MAKIEDFNTGQTPVWCPGCGNFGILMAVRSALAELNIKRENTLIVSGIGCSDKYNQYVNTYAFESIHGRILPVAMGARLANYNLKVVCIGGDGDGYGIGMCHFVHAARRNLNLTYIVCDNQIYGLTTGQTSPTSDKGFKTKSTPNGNIEMPVNPLTIALSAGATYVARGFAGDVATLKELIKGGIQHNGFAVIDVFQPCVTFNYKNTYEWFNAKLYKLGEDHDTSSKEMAFKRANESEKLPIGLFYKEDKPTYEDEALPAKAKPLVEQDISNVNVDDLMDELM